LKQYNLALLVEVGPPRLPVLCIGGLSKRGFLPSFSTPFSGEIMEALCPKKVKMPSIKSFDGTGDPNDYLDVCKS